MPRGPSENARHGRRRRAHAATNASSRLLTCGSVVRRERGAPTKPAARWKRGTKKKRVARKECGARRRKEAGTATRAVPAVRSRRRRRNAELGRLTHDEHVVAEVRVVRRHRDLGEAHARRQLHLV